MGFPGEPPIDVAADPGPCGVRLNEFQRTMLQWSDLHPYNAVHVAGVEGGLDPDLLAAAAARVLRLTGLARCRIAPGHRCFFVGGDAPCPVELVPGGDDPLEAVRREVERQLDLPFAFADGELFQPFRLFVVEAGATTYAGLAYYHVVADADAVSRLLAEILGAVGEGPGRPKALRDPGLARRRGLRPPLGGIRVLARRIPGAIRKFQAMRRSHRSPACPVEGGYGNRWFARSLDAASSALAFERARERRATFNDLCLAALLFATVPTTVDRLVERRRELSVGCVVNLRGMLPAARRRDFGLCLGSFTVTHTVFPGIFFDELVEEVRLQTEEVKREKLYLASAFEYRLNRLLFDRQPELKKSNFYRKAFPVWGSITNFKLDLGEAGARAKIVDYFRAVSAGPALPFVVSVTGVGGRLNFGFTYRPEVVDGGEVAAIADRFLDLLQGKGEAA